MSDNGAVSFSRNGQFHLDKSGYIVNEKAHATDVAAARNEAISYAAYRVLTVRQRGDDGTPSSAAHEVDRRVACLALPAAPERRGHDGPRHRPRPRHHGARRGAQATSTMAAVATTANPPLPSP